MPEMKGITVCVGEWYAKLLAITLPRNMRHMTECVVVTTPDDEATKAVVAGVPGARCFETTAFFEGGASFNKGWALECGFDQLGRSGWFAVWDSDILWPDSLPIENIRPGQLYGALRRTLDDPSQWTPEYNWRNARPERDGGPIGFMQLFHADDPYIKGKRPWYGINFPHAGGCDAFFMSHWPSHARKVLAFECLHLGPRDRHWWGTSPESVDKMSAYVHHQGWQRAMRSHDPKARERVGELPERVDVPGYTTSDFLMPFERRARERDQRRRGR